MIHDDSHEFGYSVISMNKWTGEISDVNPRNYKLDEK
jgi:hypothetical protein